MFNQQRHIWGGGGVGLVKTPILDQGGKGDVFDFCKKKAFTDIKFPTDSVFKRHLGTENFIHTARGLDLVV